MKLKFSKSRSCAGVSLIECMVYIAVFSILLGLGTAAFFFCWDHTRAVIYATNDIETAVHVGEGWRADIRAATGKISVTTNATGEAVTIPEGKQKIIYRFANNELRREISSQNNSRLLLDKVNASAMKLETRGDVAAWRWELGLTPRRKETMPLWFTFEAVPKTTP